MAQQSPETASIENTGEVEHHAKSRTRALSHRPIIALDRPLLWSSGAGRDLASKFLVDMDKPTPGNEFGSSFIWVHDWEKFAQTVNARHTLRPLAGIGLVR